jgi:hypothetical protein
MPGETKRAKREALRLDPLWPGQLAIVAAILLSLALPERLTVGPTWLLSAIEAAGLFALVVLAPLAAGPGHPGRRMLGLGVVAILSAATIVSVALLVHYLVGGGHVQNGRELILAGLVLWLTNVLVFGLWYWELDRGGPVARAQGAPDDQAAFLFTQMTDPTLPWWKKSWRPRFADYLYVSLTNATAFSPTDTMPLTLGAKWLMGLQGIVSLTIIGLVVARAVNILT